MYVYIYIKRYIKNDRKKKKNRFSPVSDRRNNNIILYVCTCCKFDCDRCRYNIIIRQPEVARKLKQKKPSTYCYYSMVFFFYYNNGSHVTRLRRL